MANVAKATTARRGLGRNESSPRGSQGLAKRLPPTGPPVATTTYESVTDAAAASTANRQVVLSAGSMARIDVTSPARSSHAILPPPTEGLETDPGTVRFCVPDSAPTAAWMIE